MSNKLFIIGVGPGSRDFLPPAAKTAIERSDVLVGGARHLEAFEDFPGIKVPVGNNLKEICQFITENIIHRKITVLASGDPMLYGIARYLLKNLEGVQIEVLPGISSLQYLCSKAGISLDEMHITSVHGREKDITQVVGTYGKVGLFTGVNCTADEVGRRLTRAGLGSASIVVGENLSYPEERMVVGTAQELAEMSFGPLSVMVIQREEQREGKGNWPYAVPGIPDERFERGQVPMTKEEIRAISLCKLRLERDSILYDIGAGTGSVAVECALRSPGGHVYAFEKEEDAVLLIKKNGEKFGASNMTVVHGEVPGTFSEELPPPDRVFIGGSGGNMFDIVERIAGFKKPVRVVANTITIESTCEVLQALQQNGFIAVEIVNVSVARSREAGGKHLMLAVNPVYIISGEWGNVQ